MAGYRYTCRLIIDHSPQNKIMNRKALLVNNESARIPLTLQSIFLKGNRGIVVNAPPPGNVAMKKFHKWRWRTDDSKPKSSVAAGFTTNNDPIMNSEAGDKKTKKKRVRRSVVVKL